MNWIKIFEYTANYIILPSPLFTPTRHPKLIRRVPHSSHQSRRRMVQPLPTAAAPRERLPSVRAVPRARRPRGFPYPREGPRLRRKLRRAACGGGWRGGGGRGCCRERTRGAPPARAGRGPQSLSARGPHVSAPLPHASHRLPPREARTFTPPTTHPPTHPPPPTHPTPTAPPSSPPPSGTRTWAGRGSHRRCVQGLGDGGGGGGWGGCDR